MAFYEKKQELLQCYKVNELVALPHLHKEIEMIYIREGKNRVFVNRKNYPLSKGDLFIAFPHQIHYYDNSEKGDFLVLIPSGKIFFEMESELYSSEPETNVVHIEKGSDIEHFLDMIYIADGERKVTETGAYINLILAKIIPQLSLRPITQTSNNTVKSILEYCSRHYSENISLDSIAQNLHLNKYYISHVINDQMDMKISDFINSLRINTACDLLRETDKKITDISEDVGFGAIRSFNRTFLELMKVTPSEYREIHRKKP